MEGDLLSQVNQIGFVFIWESIWWLLITFSFEILDLHHSLCSLIFGLSSYFKPLIDHFLMISFQTIFHS